MISGRYRTTSGYRTSDTSVVTTQQLEASYMFGEITLQGSAMFGNERSCHTTEQERDTC